MKLRGNGKHFVKTMWAEICKIQEGKYRARRKTRTNDHSKQTVKCGMSFRQPDRCILLISLSNSPFSNLLRSSSIFSSFRVISIRCFVRIPSISCQFS